jgi:2-polyprenyl-3-methyl-5-hydroxy-6-metoxy-1,4-benzoquinol methylase
MRSSISSDAGKGMPSEPPPRGGVETFDTEAALEINQARLAHLESLDLPIEGTRVLDVGYGVGHLAQFFIRKGCDVLCVDGREHNIADRSRT